jgi:hypothetical protein
LKQVLKFECPRDAEDLLIGGSLNKFRNLGRDAVEQLHWRTGR